MITSEAELDALYGEPVPAAVLKELPVISEDYRRFIDASPFVLLATVGPEGLDCSPRGDPAGFARVLDERTLLIPDRRGNNRVDSLRNIVRDPRVALLFLIPGIGETLRVNGRAVLSREEALCRSFAVGERNEKVPTCVIVVTVDAVYTQCPKALVRAKLWDPATQVDRSTLPSMGEILQRISAGAFDGAAYDAAYPERLRQTIY
ncbi:MAG: pyridoxamine 5'-phosphate oxidase family protein [Acidimicrobiales bacterium]|nr:pyridoxamine 5'-phosphate oxidase family protein [Acidimicrobiales bacterium]